MKDWKSWALPPLAHGCKLIDLILRPQLTLESVATLVPTLRTELDKGSCFT